MANFLLKKLNNEIIAWENLYGESYTYLYNPDGSIREGLKYDDSMFENLRINKTVMQVLKKIKRNRFKDTKRLNKRKFKIGGK